VALSGTPSKKFKVPSRVSTRSGVVISGGISVAIFGLMFCALAGLTSIDGIDRSSPDAATSPVAPRRALRRVTLSKILMLTSRP
jgi:hypothetical protein